MESVKFLFFAKKRRAVARLIGTIRKFRMVAVSRSSVGLVPVIGRWISEDKAKTILTPVVTQLVCHNLSYFLLHAKLRAKILKFSDMCKENLSFLTFRHKKSQPPPTCL